MRRRHQAGATAVEFALVMLLFLTFTLGILDFTRMLFTWNAASEATRAGARYAVVCHDGTSGATPAVLSRVKAMVPAVQSVNVTWHPTGCTAATCQGVAVSITGLQHRWLSPLVALPGVGPIDMPGFSTYLMREAMRQDVNSPFIC